MKTEKQRDNQKEQSASSRVFKLRAWDIERKVMQYGDSISIDLDWYIRRGWVNRTNRYTIMQYTWLKDKNWKEIYENDIVRVLYTDRPSKPSDDTRTLEQYLVDKSTIMEVIFSQDSFCLQSYSGKYEDYNHSSILPWKHWFIEVIWNIYENPGLLIDSDYHLS